MYNIDTSENIVLVTQDCQRSSSGTTRARTATAAGVDCVDGNNGTGAAARRSAMRHSTPACYSHARSVCVITIIIIIIIIFTATATETQYPECIPFST